MPLWQEAQARIECVPGSERLGALLAELAAVRGRQYNRNSMGCKGHLGLIPGSFKKSLCY